MARNLTEGQKAARRCIRAAMREVLRKVDELDFRRNGLEFRADFHLACIGDQSHGFGKPPKSVLVNCPVYSGTIVRHSR